MSPAKATLLLDVAWSDGIHSAHPPLSDCTPPANPSRDTCNYYRRLARSTAPATYALYETKLGAAVATAADPELATNFLGCLFVLSALPSGYALFEHCKRNKHDGPMRVDVYLYGHPSGGRFRSPNEFVPHLLWLLSDVSRDRDNCGCCLCAKQASAELDLFTPALHASLPDDDRMFDLANPEFYRKGEIVWYAPTATDITRVAPFLPASFTAVDRTWHPAVVLSRASASSYTLLALPPRVICDVTPQHMRPFASPVSSPPSASCWDSAVRIAQHSYSLLESQEYYPATFFLGPDKLRTSDFIELCTSHTGLRRVGHITAIAHTDGTDIQLRGAIYEQLKSGGVRDTRVPRGLKGAWRVASARCVIPMDLIVGRFRPEDLAALPQEERAGRWTCIELSKREMALGVRGFI
ncbi:uncharacterized protein V1518DRAFT_266656 [Limtongia smithiae]|uniref:uncharacterized protein n=1 Tax=Limtongia smithiae TaxID=1125753 RepID=UPI0034CF3D1F